MATINKSVIWPIEGEMTIYNAATLRQTLLEKFQQHESLHIDLSAVSEMDTAGFQLLLLARREAELTGKALSICNPSVGVTDVLTMFHSQHLIKEDQP